MGDVICRVCGEPWDFYGIMHGDVTPEEAQDILNGRGCPSCKGKPPQPKTETEYVLGCNYDFCHELDGDCKKCYRDYLERFKERHGKPKTLEWIRSIDEGTDLDATAFM